MPELWGHLTCYFESIEPDEAAGGYDLCFRLLGVNDLVNDLASAKRALSPSKLRQFRHIEARITIYSSIQEKKLATLTRRQGGKLLIEYAEWLEESPSQKRKRNAKSRLTHPKESERRPLRGDS
jgi:hypothetical protein